MQSNEDIKFPLYRKSTNGKRYYKIVNKREFEEIQVVGNKHFKNLIIAKQFPEIQYIQSLINCEHGFTEPCKESEFTLVCSKVLPS